MKEHTETGTTELLLIEIAAHEMLAIASDQNSQI